MRTYSVTKLSAVAKVVPPSGTRLARIIVKESAKTQNLPESLGVFVPLMSNSVVQTALTNDAILEGVRSYLESIQNAVIRATIDSGKSVTDESLHLDSLADWIAANEESSIRLSGDSVGKWFDDVAQSHIQSMILIQRGLKPEDALAIAKNYRTLYQLAAKKDGSFPSDDVMAKVKATIAYVADKLSDDDSLGMKILTKLAGMKVATIDTLAL
jgi:hypothetical protein